MESAGTLKFTAVKFNIVVCLVVVPYVAEAYYVQEMDVETEQKKKNLRKAAMCRLKGGAVFP